jgi:membrane protein DedA with SNARE-associated domain
MLTDYNGSTVILPFIGYLGYVIGTLLQNPRHSQLFYSSLLIYVGIIIIMAMMKDNTQCICNYTELHTLYGAVAVD